MLLLKTEIIQPLPPHPVALLRRCDSAFCSCGARVVRVSRGFFFWGGGGFAGCKNRKQAEPPNRGKRRPPSPIGKPCRYLSARTARVARRGTNFFCSLAIPCNAFLLLCCMLYCKACFFLGTRVFSREIDGKKLVPIIIPQLVPL